MISRKESITVVIPLNLKKRGYIRTGWDVSERGNSLIIMRRECFKSRTRNSFFSLAIVRGLELVNYLFLNRVVQSWNFLPNNIGNFPIRKELAVIASKEA